MGGLGQSAPKRKREVDCPGGAYGAPEERCFCVAEHSQMLLILPVSSQLPTWKMLSHPSRWTPLIASSVRSSIILSGASVFLFLLLQCCEGLVIWYSYHLLSYSFPLNCRPAPLQARTVSNVLQHLAQSMK